MSQQKKTYWETNIKHICLPAQELWRRCVLGKVKEVTCNVGFCEKENIQTCTRLQQLHLSFRERFASSIESGVPVSVRLCVHADTHTFPSDPCSCVSSQVERATSVPRTCLGQSTNLLHVTCETPSLNNLHPSKWQIRHCLHNALKRRRGGANGTLASYAKPNYLQRLLLRLGPGTLVRTQTPEFGLGAAVLEIETTLLYTKHATLY